MEHKLIPFEDVYKNISFAETLELLSFLRNIMDSTKSFPVNFDTMQEEYESLESLVIDGFLPFEHIKTIKHFYSSEI